MGGPGEQGVDGGECFFGGFDTGIDEAGDLGEIVPGDAVHVGGDDDVGMAAPVGFGAALHDLEAAIDDGEDAGRVGGDLGRRQGDADGGDDAGSAKGLSGDLHADGAIDEKAAVVAHGLKEAGIGATGADGLEDLTVFAKDDGVAGGEVGGDDGEGELHILEVMDGEDAAEEVLHAVAGGDTEAADAPAGDVLELHGTGDGFEVMGIGATGETGGDDRSGADAGDPTDGDALAFEDAEDAEVSDATGEATAESEADANGHCRMRRGVEAIPECAGGLGQSVEVHEAPPQLPQQGSGNPLR